MLQSMFVSDGKGRVDNTTAGAVREWLAAVDAIQPSRVHVYTIDRAPAMEGLRPVSSRRLREIAERVERKRSGGGVCVDARGSSNAVVILSDWIRRVRHGYG